MSAPDASDQALPCRPTISCTADCAKPGTLELEACYLYARTGDYATTRNFPFLLKLTLSKMLQAQITSNGLTFAPGMTYFDDLFVGLKVHIADQGKYTPSIGISGLVGIPTYQYVDVLVTGFVSKDVGPIHFDLNGGVEQIGLDVANGASQGFVSLAASMSLPRPFGAALEAYYLSDAPGGLAPHDGGVRFVITATPKPWLVFDVGGDVGWFPSVRAFSAFFGVTVIPWVFWRPAPTSNRK